LGVSGSELRRELLRLLREDEEFRYAVAGLLGLEEILKRLGEHDRKFNEITARLEEHDRKFNELLERIRRVEEALEALSRQVQALGVRWGLLSEEAFRRGMKAVLERVVGGGHVEKWVYHDREGIVYGYPSVVEVDIVVRDDGHYLVEVKASASRGDVVELKRMGDLYERVTGVKPKLILVTPQAHPKAKEAARALGVELYEAA
jgi:hypothetical protein